MEQIERRQKQAEKRLDKILTCLKGGRITSDSGAAANSSDTRDVVSESAVTVKEESETSTVSSCKW